MLNDRYRIVRVLGRGGMGTVYLAEHIRLETVVAVKEVSGPRSNEDEYRLALQQCEQEAKFLVRLHHPNLPRVMDAFIENDRFYLVMEYIEGVTLENRMRDGGDGPLDVHEVVEWGLQIADVLAYLHSQEPPIIFRDLKPANIMVQPDGSVRLIDFGIARRFHPGASKDTALLGSVGYSPPEQFGRSQTDTRSDLYAFGATLHHLLTGRDPAAEPFKFPPSGDTRLPGGKSLGLALRPDAARSGRPNLCAVHHSGHRHSRRAAHHLRETGGSGSATSPGEPRGARPLRRGIARRRSATRFPACSHSPSVVDYLWRSDGSDYDGKVRKNRE